jgi:hypothetical protein
MTLTEHRSMMERFDRLDQKLDFINDKKLMKLFEAFEVESQRQYEDYNRFHYQGDDFQATICEGRYFGLCYAMDMMMDIYPWLRKDEDD